MGATPEPRNGLRGVWDRFVGPGPTRSESKLTCFTMLVGLVGAPAYASLADADWTLVEFFISAFLGLDLLGGVAVNASGAAKRWYHRRGQGIRQHVGFVALHGLHVALVAFVFRSDSWSFFALVYAVLLLTALVILLVPPTVQRPVALLLTLTSTLGVISVIGSTPHLEWFLPVFFTKLLVAHIVTEEPYPSRVDA